MTELETEVKEAIENWLWFRIFDKRLFEYSNVRYQGWKYNAPSVVDQTP